MPPVEDCPESVVIAPSRSGRILRRMVVAALVLSAAAWYSFRPAPIQPVPGSVDVVPIEGGRVAYQLFSDETTGRGYFAAGRQDDDWAIKFRCEKWPEITTSKFQPRVVAYQDVLRLSGDGFVRHAPGRDSIISLGSWVARVDNGKVVSEAELVVSAADFSQEPYRSSVFWDGATLTALCSSTDLEGTTVAWTLTYDLSDQPSHRQVLPRTVVRHSFNPIVTSPIATRFGSSADEWMGLQFRRLNEPNPGQKLFFSDGVELDLYVPNAIINGTPTDGVYFGFAGSPGDERWTLFRITPDGEGVKAVDVVRPGSGLVARPALNLPTRYINTRVSDVSENGRYVAITSNDFRGRTMPAVLSWLPFSTRTTVTRDLVVLDLASWRIAGSTREEEFDYGDSLSAWSQPLFDADSQHLLIPQGTQYSVIDLERWIDKSEPSGAQ